ncbi:hypothetical protein [Roseivirga pacifica]|jgi:hypothetical protein|uniref:hypothetical protein n=1 Tax=Roseivirga pacifica TaxID=1267423 RepID=UPI003BABEC52
MKKLVLSTLAIALFGFSTAAVAQSTEGAQAQEAQVQQQENKTAIKMEEVPEAVKEGWDKKDYKAENVEKIFKVKTDSEEYIEFIVKGTMDKKAVHFDLNGNFLREKVIDTL